MDRIRNKEGMKKMIPKLRNLRQGEAQRSAFRPFFFQNLSEHLGPDLSGSFEKWRTRSSQLSWRNYVCTDLQRGQLDLHRRRCPKHRQRQYCSYYTGSHFSTNQFLFIIDREFNYLTNLLYSLILITRSHL